MPDAGKFAPGRGTQKPPPVSQYWYGIEKKLVVALYQFHGQNFDSFFCQTNFLCFWPSFGVI